MKRIIILVLVLVIEAVLIISFYISRHTKSTIYTQGFVINEIKFDSEDEYVESFDINDTGDKIAAITLPKKPYIGSRKAKMYVLNNNGSLLYKGEAEIGNNEQLEIIFNADDSIFISNAADGIISRYNDQVKSIPLTYDNKRATNVWDARLPEGSAFDKNGKSVSSVNIEDTWTYILSENYLFEHKCLLPGFPDGGCANIEETISFEDKKITFRNLRIKITGTNRYVLNNNKLLLIVQGATIGDKSSNKLYILE